MNVNFELYKIFYEVANSKSISKGAEKLLISQPAVTQAIQTLESQLGGKLFVRTPKGVVLTNEGKELYNYVKEGMTYFVNGANKFMSLKTLECGVLNIGATTTISENYLIPHLKKFNELHPNVSINITNDLTDNLLKNLRNGNLDIVIMAIPDYEIKDLKVENIMELNDIFVGGKKYKDISLNPDDLLNKDIREIKGEEETKNKLNKTIDDILNFITDVISLFSNMSFKSKLKCIFEQFVIMGLLFIVSTIIVEISSMIFDNVLIFLPEKLNYFIENLLISFVIIFCIIASIIIIIHIFKTRYLNYYIKLKNNSDHNLDNITTEDDEKVKKDEIIDKKNKISLKNNEDKIIIRDPSHSEYGFINGLFKFIVGVIKIFSLIISIALCFFLTGLFVGFISSFLLYKTGLFFIGLLLFLLSIAVIDVILILVLFNFIFKISPVLTLLASFIILSLILVTLYPLLKICNGLSNSNLVITFSTLFSFLEILFLINISNLLEIFSILVVFFSISFLNIILSLSIKLHNFCALT